MILHGLSVRSWDIAFAIYVTSGALIDVALVYCSMHGADNLEICWEILEVRYLSETIECVNAVLDGTDQWQHLKYFVDNWLAEFHLNEWIGRMNELVGVAPCYESVFSQYKTLCFHRSDLDTAYSKSDSRRKWVQRFMEKWDSVRGCVNSHEMDNAATVVTKVYPKIRRKTFLKFDSDPNFWNTFCSCFVAPLWKTF